MLETLNDVVVSGAVFTIIVLLVCASLIFGRK